MSAGKDEIMKNGPLDWKLGVVLIMAVTLVVAAALVVRSWAKQTCLRPSGHPVTSSTR